MSVEFMKLLVIVGVIGIAGLVSFRAANVVVTGLAEAVGSMVDAVSGGCRVAGAKMALQIAKGSRLSCRRRYRVHRSLVSDRMTVLGLRAAFANTASGYYWGKFMRSRE